MSFSAAESHASFVGEDEDDAPTETEISNTSEVAFNHQVSLSASGRQNRQGLAAYRGETYTDDTLSETDTHEEERISVDESIYASLAPKKINVVESTKFNTTS